MADDRAEACAADGSGWEARPCAGHTTCLGGRCVSLQDGDGPPIERARLFAVGGEGWLSAWSGAWPLFAGSVEPLVSRPDGLFGPEGKVALRAVCAPDGFVAPLGKLDPKPPPSAFAVLGGYLIADRARTVRLAIGPAGGLRVWVNGALAVEASRATGRPFKDELVTPATLREGPNRVTIALEQPDEGGAGFWLRVHDDDNRVPPLLFATASASASCSLGDLVAIEPALTPVAGGFDLSVTARLAGLAPRGAEAAGELSVTAELRRESGKPLASLAPEPAKVGAVDLLGAAAVARVSVTPPKPGKYEVAVGVGPARRAVPVVFRGELADRVVAVARKVGELGAIPEASRSSLESDARTLLAAIAAGHPDLPWIAERLAETEKLVAVAGEGRDPYLGKTGVVHRAYRSELDGELQRYVLFVPRSHKPDGKPLPLVVVAHGLNRLPEHALRTVIGEAPDDTMEIGWAARHLPGFPDQRAILAAPSAFGNAGQRPLGEHDILRVIDEVRASYRVDERRVSITGYSLGGTVAFAVPLHYPDRFSGAAPLCGYPDLLRWESIRNVPHAPWEDVLLTRRYVVSFAENGLHLPLHIVHGGLDGPGRSAVVADRYDALGYRRIFDVQDDLDHNVWDYAYEDGRMIEWLKARRRPEAPAHVRLATGEYRYDRAFWVRLVAMRPGMEEDADRGKTGQIAEIDAEWRKADGEVKVTTRNVAALALDLGALGASGAKIVIDGATLEAGAADGGASGEVFLERGPAGWARTPSAPSRAGHKRPGVSGPLDDALRHPELIVYGTRDPAQTEANRLVAQHFSSFDMWAAARFPIKADHEVTEADLTGRTLVLVGNPESNSVTAALAGDLPVRFEPGALTLRGKRYEGADVGVSLICPHPRDPNQYVVLHAGTRAEGTLASRHLPRFAPDYLVYDARLTTRRTDNLLGDRAVLAGGFFGDDWR